MTGRIRKLLGAALLVAASSAVVPTALAGEFVINPLRVTLDRATRSSEILVRNDDQMPLRMQVQAMSWTQNADGVDQYENSDALLYFPRTMEIPPGESRIVRVGVRGAPVSREEAYRLFIEELPPAGSEADAQGTSLRVFLRVGVAVFVTPAQPERKAEISRMEMIGRQVEWAVVNTGNVHVRADQVELTGVARDGRTLFVQPFSERYFLAGVTRPLRYEVPSAACADLASIVATVVAERIDQTRKIDVAAGSCK
jgi:fimbrial chaperone protein